MIKKYLFLYWDGVVFFGFDDSKLERQRGRPASYLDKCSSLKRIILYLLAIGIIAYVLITEISKLGDPKSQEVQLLTDHEF